MDISPYGFKSRPGYIAEDYRKILFRFLFPSYLMIDILIDKIKPFIENRCSILMKLHSDLLHSYYLFDFNSDGNLIIVPAYKSIAVTIPTSGAGGDPCSTCVPAATSATITPPTNAHKR